MNQEKGAVSVVFVIPLLLGFALAGASAFTAAFSRWRGERGGQIATSILRNFVGIPLWMFGFMMAWLQPAPRLLNPSRATRNLALLLIAAGSVPVIWGHLPLGWRTHFPSVRDTLVRDGLYVYVCHPIYAGGLLIFVGLALLKPASTVLLACAIAFGWLIIEARLEEIDLVQRLPTYRQYMTEVPRFLPRLRRKRP
jgi:protein-S-isoprenylcysteine O-methyltransferase Ste14